MSWRYHMAAVLVLGACAPATDPEQECQQRLVDAVNATGQQISAESEPGADPFGHRHFAGIDRAGCTAAQLAALDRILELTQALPDLNERNDRAAESGDASAHMAAFQRMNNAVIELDDLQQAAKADLERMIADGGR